MKLYTPLQLNILVTRIEDTDGLEILVEYVMENNENYSDQDFFRITDRINNKHKALRRIKE
jgi:hypothetical protein